MAAIASFVSTERRTPLSAVVLLLLLGAGALYAESARIRPGHPGWPRVWTTYRKATSLEADIADLKAHGVGVYWEYKGSRQYWMFGGGCDAKLQRILFGTNMLSGAVGHCYGADAIWQFNTGEELFGASPGGHMWGNTPWEQAEPAQRNRRYR